MAPIQSDSDSGMSSVSDAEVAGTHQSTNGPNGGIGGVEEEFHTDDSEPSDDEGAAVPDEVETDDEDDGVINSPAPGVPLLPESLLKQLSNPRKQSGLGLSDTPWEQLTAGQKKARRSNSRKLKKRQYDTLREHAEGTGVIEAGKAAQNKRGIVPAKQDRVMSGRVGKKTAKGRERVQVSGRQQLVEQRKRAVGQAAGDVRRPVKKAKTKSKR